MNKFEWYSANPLRKWRNVDGHRLTQMEIAHKIGVSRQTAADWEKGGVQPASDNLLKLAGMMAMKPETLRKLWATWYSSRSKITA
jgi:DNA-binding XRE family transcriptional regulator